MKVFLDTSVLLASLLVEHDAHERAFPILERIQNGRDEGHLSAHSLAETYAALTRIPPPFRHAPEQALLSIEENVLKHFTLSSLSAGEYAALIRVAAASGFRGGTIYDAILLKCAAKAGVERIYTLNLKHFQAVATEELGELLATP